MRVWIENPFDNLPGEGYRPGRYEMMAEALASAGHEVTWFSSDFSHTKKVPRASAVRREGRFELVLVPTRPYRRNVSLARILSHRVYARAWARMARARLADGRGPDLLVVSAPPLATGAAALEIRRRCGCRLVVDVQDAWPETFARLLPSWMRPWAAPLLLAPLYRAARTLYREADLVTGVCERYRALVQSAGARRYERFYLGIAAGAQTPAPHPVRRSLRLAYVGNLGRGYDLATVEAALARVPEATLDIAGACAPGVSGRVRRHGYLDEASLKALLASCDVGVVPMSADSFVGLPNKLADYARAGLAVVSSLEGECAEMLRRTEAGETYRAGCAESLAATLAAMVGRTYHPERLLSELAAGPIYRAYVRCVTEGL